ncbi:hypothetical protein R5R35_000493 [Gryllus longicercus]|uniref:CRAL-TRIO domain-containing protein n=1 Tax=Gryllus longicercus TaxID=2509291 RepID=A0AAN9VIY4_9ORTH
MENASLSAPVNSPSGISGSANVLSEVTTSLPSFNKVDEKDALVKKIQIWIVTQPQLNARTDIVYLLRFLRGCKYDVEKTKRKIANFYTIRAKAPEWFLDRDPLLPAIQEMLNMGVFLPLHNRDHEGRLVVVIRAAVHNPNFHLQSDVLKVGKMILDLVLEEDESVPVKGVVAIIDLQGVSLGHALQLTPAVIKKAVHTWQDCYPVSPKRLDFINAPMYVNVVLNVFRKFMKDKMRKRVYVHSGHLNNLHKEVPKSILPKEYGGSDGCVSELTEYWKQKTIASREWFIEDEKYKAFVE